MAAGRGMINILAADQLMNSPRLYTTFLLWMLSELFENLPEVGDLDKPKLVFFFDEAHLLFNDAPKVLIERIELVVRLVRSKGVGVYFVTQNPLDIPDSVLAQLGNRVQHALRAFTPRDQKAVKSAADTMRPNPGLDVATAITELGVGEALVSFLDEKGRPCLTERVYVLPPASQIGPITAAQRQSPDRRVHRGRRLRKNRWTANRPMRSSRGTPQRALRRPTAKPGASRAKKLPQRQVAACSTASARAWAACSAAAVAGARSAGEQLFKSAASSIGREVGRQIIRGVLGGIFGGSKR